MKVVISLGGHLFTKDLESTKELNIESYKPYADTLKKLKEYGHKVIAVCGAGKFCRDYIRVAKEFKASKELQDWIGIEWTHINALMLIAALGEDAYQKSLRTVEDIKKHFDEDKILVAGGNLPGSSTDYDAALFAEAVKADLLINATNVDGVYSDDPNKDPNAKKYDRLSFEEFEKIIAKNPQEPGEYRLFDLLGAKVIKRARVKTIIIDGNDPEEIIRAVEGRHKGTLVFG